MNARKEYLTFLWRVSSVHMIAYFLAGIFALAFMAYGKWFAAGTLAIIMRPIDSPWVAAGPALQIFRGLIIALVLYPFKDVFLSAYKGWLKLWLLVAGLSYLSTLGPTLGSFEGYIYTQASLGEHLVGLPEMLIYTVLFSVSLYVWYKHPRRLWTVLSIALVILILLMSGLGVLSSLGIIGG